MKVLIGITLIAVLILVGQRKTFVRFKMLYVTGTEFLLFGFLLGDAFAGVLDPATLKGLAPVVGLGLGWIGFLYGLQFELRTLRRFPVNYFLVSVIQALVTIALVGVAAYVVLLRVGVERSAAVVTAAILAATASCSTQTVLALMSRSLRIRRLRVMKVLRYVASVGDLPGLFVLGIAFCLLHPTSLFGVERFVLGQWLTLSLILGAIFGLLFVYLLKFVRNEEELLVVLLGVVFFSAGAASYLNFSPLFVNLISGFVAVNLAGQSHRIVEMIHHPERPIYLTFLIVAGAALQFTSVWAGLLALAYVFIRLVAKSLGGFLGAGSILKRQPVPAMLGLGLTAQGGMAVAMIVNYQMISQTALGKTIVAGVVLAIVLNELLSPPLIQWLLRAREEA